MRKYTTPEMTYKCFAAESVITASGEDGKESSMSLLQKNIKSNSVYDGASIIEGNWNSIKND